MGKPWTVDSIPSSYGCDYYPLFLWDLSTSDVRRHYLCLSDRFILFNVLWDSLSCYKRQNLILLQCLLVPHCVCISTTLSPFTIIKGGSVFSLLWVTCPIHGRWLHIFLQPLYFSSFGYFPRRTFAPSQCHSNSSFPRNYIDAYHNVYTKLCSKQPSLRVPFPLHPCQSLYLLAFYKGILLALRWFLTLGLMGISQGGWGRTSFSGHGVISMSSLAKTDTSLGVNTFSDIWVTNLLWTLKIIFASHLHILHCCSET